MLAQRPPLFQIWSLLAPKNKMATAKMQTQGFKAAVHAPMADVTDDICPLFIQSGTYEDQS